MQFIGQYWRGEKPLWKAFWLWGILFPVLFMIVLIIAMSALLVGVSVTSLVVGAGVVGIVYTIMWLVYYTWNFVSIWRCAVNSSTVWKVLARIWVVLGAIGMIFSIITTLLGTLMMEPSSNGVAPQQGSTSFYQEDSSMSGGYNDLAVTEEAVPETQPLQANTDVEYRVTDMINHYGQTKEVVSAEDQHYLIQNWNEAMTFLTSVLLSGSEEQGMGAAYIFLDMGESFIPMFEEKMKDNLVALPVRVRLKWVLMNMRTPNDKADYANYIIEP